MREDDGRKLDHATLETMRIRAVKRIEAGARVEDVATALGLSRSAVFGWMAAYREGGEQALRAKPMPGRPRKLSGAQLRTLYMLIEGSDPRQYQLEFALWARELVQQLIWPSSGSGYPWCRSGGCCAPWASHRSDRCSVPSCFAVLLIKSRLRPRLRGRPGFLAGWPARGMDREISRR